MVFFAKSMRMNCGAPKSDGKARKQVSPGSQACASIVAHSSGLLPSNSAAHNVAEQSPLNTAIAASGRRTHFLFMGPSHAACDLYYTVYRRPVMHAAVAR
jgi:hypothetical protein